MRIFIALTILCLSPVFLLAHPHVFIDLSLSYERAQKRLKVLWEIDEMSSNLIAMDYDANRNGRFEPSEVQVFFGKEGYAMLFRRGGYFMHPSCRVENLQAELADGRVRITFEAGVTSDRLGIWDDEHMFAFQLKAHSGVPSIEESDDYYGYTVKLH